MYIYWLVVSTPLKNMKSVGIIIPNIWKILNVPNHQSDYLWLMALDYVWLTRWLVVDGCSNPQNRDTTSWYSQNQTLTYMVNN